LAQALAMISLQAGHAHAHVHGCKASSLPEFVVLAVWPQLKPPPLALPDSRCQPVWVLLAASVGAGRRSHRRKLRLAQHGGDAQFVIRHCSQERLQAIKAGEELASLARERRWHGIDDIFANMRHAAIAPDLVHLNTAITVCARSQRPDEAEVWFARIHQNGLSPDLISFAGVINAHAQVGGAAKAEHWLRNMLQANIEADGIAYSSVINAHARAGDDPNGAEYWLEQMLAAQVEANQVTYGTVINACARHGDATRAEAWLKRMLRARVEANEVTCSSVINSCAQLKQAEYWLRWMLRATVKVNEIAYNSVINACARHGDVDNAELWFDAMQQAVLEPTEVSYNSVINACAQRGSVLLGERWLRWMARAAIRPSQVSYNSLLSACARLAVVEKAEHWLTEMVGAAVQPNSVSYSAMRTACARTGDFDRAEHWLAQMIRCDDEGHAKTGAWAKALSAPADDEIGRSGGPLNKALYCFSSAGDARVVECLERALELQWVYGYPHVPPGERQLTHGFYKYMAGMQPMVAREALKLVPDASTVLDTFCGSGTVLIEAMVAGKRAFGCDASPLAVFVAGHHCDERRVDLEELVHLAEQVVAPLQGGPGDWQTLRRNIAALASTTTREALWFVFAVALRIARSTSGSSGITMPQRPVDPDHRLARLCFLSNVYRYVSRVRDFRQAAGHVREVSIFHSDNRKLCLQRPVDAILTGPPYPGVYNYQSAAAADMRMIEGGHVRLGACEAAEELIGSTPAWAAVDTAKELGTKELQQSSGSLEQFLSSWQTQQEEWLAAARSNLKPGGTATLMIGDGDTDEENGIDCLASTVDAAISVGFDVIATASIESCADAAHRTKGRLRTEHMIHMIR